MSDERDPRIEAVGDAMWEALGDPVWESNGIVTVNEDDFEAMVSAALAAADQFSIDAALDAVGAKNVETWFLESSRSWWARIAAPVDPKNLRAGMNHYRSLDTETFDSPTAAILAACKAAKEAQP